MQAIDGAVAGNAARRIPIPYGMWLAFVASVGGFGVGMGLTGPEMHTGLVVVGTGCAVSALARLLLALRGNAKAP